MESFPAFVPLKGARVVVVGDGEAAAAKARLFEGAPCELVRLAADAAAPGALADARLVFVAVEDEAVAGRIAQTARTAGALVNVVDKPALSDFVTPAIVDRGAVVAGIGTGGASPVLATLLRGELETRWPEGLRALAEVSRRIQPQVRSAFPDLPARRAAWRRLLAGPVAEAAMAGDLDGAVRLAHDLLAARHEPAGRVWFLQAPAQAGKLTVAAVRALGAADHIVAGADVAAEVLAYARRDAERSASASPTTLADWAAQGLSVLRIAGALDPDEIEAVEAMGGRVERLPVVG